MDVPRVYVHRGLGPRITQVASAVSIDRAYATHEPAPGTFLCDINDPAREHLNPLLGNGIMIQSRHFAPPWVGYADRVEERWAEGLLDVSLLSADSVFRDRVSHDHLFGAATVSTVFRDVLAHCNNFNDTGFRLADDLATGPVVPPQQFIDRSFYAAMTDVAVKAGYEWWAEYDGSEQGITATVEFAPKRGTFRSALLQDGGNFEVINSAIEGRAVYMEKITAGQSTATDSYSGRARVAQIASDAPIGTIHGWEVERTDIGSSPLTRRERHRVAESLKEIGAITQAASILSGYRAPERMVEGLLFVEDDDLWNACAIGNVVMFRSSRAFLGSGYDGAARVILCEPKEELGSMLLVLQMLGRRAGG